MKKTMKMYVKLGIFAEIATGLDNCIENLTSKAKYNVNNFDQWKKMILKKINLKTEN